jgi:Nucleic-acid-binding protein possibly involved in ribosomal biogenesis
MKNKQLLEPLLKSINRFVFRPSISSSAKFYSVVVLNSLKLTPADQVPLQLIIQTLLKLFPVLVSETKIYGNRAVSLLLKALNKNFPLFANKSAYQNFFSDEINEIYKLSHVNNTNIQIESLRFIFQSEQAQGFVSDRYYRALYEFILPVPAIRSITYKSQALLFNLLMISIKEDTNISRVKAFVKRILQVCLISEPPFILAGLMLLSEIVKIHKSIIQLMQVLSDDEEEAYEDVLDSDIEEEKTENHAETTKKPSKRTDYDPLKRDPKFSAAENAGLYELGILCKHPHPTISK